MDELARHGRMKNLKTVKEKRGKSIAENMLKAGFSNKIQWISSTECFVPSQTSIGTNYEVDLLNCVCSCPASTQGGFCKHVHLAQMVATTKNVDVEVERKLQAEWIFSTGNYHHDLGNNQIEIISAKGDISVVNVESMACSCFANSHGIKCFCLQVVEKVNPILSTGPENNEELPPHIEPVQESMEQTILKNLTEITLFVENGNFKNLSENKKQSVLKSLKTVHQICHFSDFGKKTNKRKQVPLNPTESGKQMSMIIVLESNRRGKKSIAN